MNNVLDAICTRKRDHVAMLKTAVSPAEMREYAARGPEPRGFVARLRKAAANGYGLIGELKKASPSKGVIRPDFDPVPLARAYEEGGATCLSILTDMPFFHGRNEYLTAAREATTLPVLRKDFTLDPYQVFEARALGADAILLILSALDDDTALELENTAHELGMDVLLEVHDAGELTRALHLSSPLIGINNRDLKTLKVDLATTESLAPAVPDDRLVVGESGLSTPEDLAHCAAVGVRCFLVGESLMRERDVAAACRALLAPAPVRLQ